jgi:hypothetical protein
MDFPGEVLLDQPIRWCCIDRLSWHHFTGEELQVKFLSDSEEISLKH